MKKLLFVLLTALFLTQPAWAADDLKIKDNNDKINYSIGYQIGGDFVSQGITLKPEMLVAGIKAAVEKTDPLITQAEMNKTLIALKEKIVADQRRQASQAAQKFMDDFAKDKNVVELPGGVKYRVVRAGTGPQPTETDSVEVQYRARRTDGTEIANTYNENQIRTYQIGRMTPGLRNVLLQMKQGAVWEVLLPSPIPDPETDSFKEGLMIYDIELVSIKAPAAKADAEKPAKKE